MRNQRWNENRSLWILCATTAIDMIGYGIVIPILPFYAESLGASPFELSLIIATFPIVQLVAFPVFGRLSDYFGRKSVIILGLAISALSYVVFGFAESLPVLLLSRLGCGIGGAIFPVAQAYVADVTDEKRRTAGMGYLGASYGVGLMLGPAIGSFASVLGYGLTGLIAALLALLGAIFAALVLPDLRPGKPSEGSRRPVGLSAWLRIYFAFPMSVVVAVYFITIIAFEGVMAMLALYLERQISLGVQGAGILWAAAGIVTVFTRLGFVGGLAARIGDRLTIITGLSLLFFGLVLVSAAASFWFALVAILPFAAGYGLVFPSLSSLASKLADKESKGSILGGYLFFGGLGRAMGPIASGLAFQELSIHFPIVVAAGLFVLTAALSFAIPAHVRQLEP